MNGVENLETERLVLRPWEPEDAGFVLDLYSRWEVQRFIGYPPRVMTDRREAEERIRAWRSMGHPVHAVWAVELRPTAQPSEQPKPAQPSNPGRSQPVLAGTLLLKSIPASGGELPLQPSGDTEIGWHFHPHFWGHGYATEAAAAVLAYAFRNGLPKVVAVTHPANTASQKVCTKTGLVHQGQTRRYYNTLCELFEAAPAASHQ